MKAFNLKEIFCELLSGFVAIVVIFLYLDNFSIYELDSSIEITIEKLTAFIFLSYFIGLVVDSIGFSIGELFLDKWICNTSTPTDAQLKNYREKADLDTKRYREEQWIFVSLYRNLSILNLIIIVLLIIRLLIMSFSWNILWLIVFLLLIELSFYKSIKSGLKIYYNLAK